MGGLEGERRVRGAAGEERQSHEPKSLVGVLDPVQTVDEVIDDVDHLVAELLLVGPVEQEAAQLQVAVRPAGLVELVVDRLVDPVVLEAVAGRSLRCSPGRAAGTTARGTRRACSRRRGGG